MNKQEEREYWTKLLADGPVWCEVWESEQTDRTRRLLVAYVGGDRPFCCVACDGSHRFASEKYESGSYTCEAWPNAKVISLATAKPRRPWTAEEIRVHGIFESKEGRVYSKVFTSKKSVFMLVAEDGVGGLIQVDISEFRQQFRAVCLELRDGILCDTGKRVELYKDGE